MKKNLHIIKFGGAVLDDPLHLVACLQKINDLGGQCIIVHGGGKQADFWLNKLGIQPNKINGRRITDDQSIEVVTMVFAGLLNKKIVARINATNRMALGISGADLNIIEAHKRTADPIDFGWVGDIDKVNSSTLIQILGHNWIPVICSLTHDGKGNLLNTNADTIATQIAIALSQTFKVYLQLIADVKGVYTDLEDDASLLSELTFSQFNQLKGKGTISGGMIPKLDNAFAGIQRGIHQIWISNEIYLQTNSLNKGTLITY